MLKRVVVVLNRLWLNFARRRWWRVARRGVGARGAGVRESMTSSGGEHRGVRVFLVVGQKALRGAAGGHWPDASAAVHADWLTELWAPPQAPSTFLGAIPTSIIWRRKKKTQPTTSTILYPLHCTARTLQGMKGTILLLWLVGREAAVVIFMHRW